MTAKQMWKTFTSQTGAVADYEAWAFGESADTLAKLTRKGIKTATSSAYPLYSLVGEEMPKAGEYSVILDSRDEAVCVIRTERVLVIPFCEVGARQAWKEGEGDRSLSHWRRVHERFFREELADFELAFDEKMPVVCEEFVKVFP